MLTKKVLVASTVLIVLILVSIFAYFSSSHTPSKISTDSSFRQSLGHGDVPLDVMISGLEAKMEDLASNLLIIANNQQRMDQQLQEVINQDSLQIGENLPISKEEEYIDKKQKIIEFQNKRQEERRTFDYRVEMAEDDPWGIEIENKLSTLLTEVPEINNVVSDLQTQCSDTLCRMEFYIPEDVDQFQLEEFELELPIRLASDFTGSTMYVERLSNGKEKKTYYMARKGYTLSGDPEVVTSSKDADL